MWPSLKRAYPAGVYLCLKCETEVLLSGTLLCCPQCGNDDPVKFQYLRPEPKKGEARAGEGKAPRC